MIGKAIKKVVLLVQVKDEGRGKMRAMEWD